MSRSSSSKKPSAPSAHVYLPVKQLLDKLNLSTANDALYLEALTHRSSGSPHYERLEFLGDSCLNFVIATDLFERYPDEDEGALSRLRASLVRESTLADIALELGLGDYIRLGSGELKSGGFNRASILADVVESLIGATFLDAGYDATRKLVLQLYGDRVAVLPPSAELKDPKTRLQEHLQGRGLSRPEYTVTETTGKSHELKFTVRCDIPSHHVSVVATDTSRRKAEQLAAADILANIETLLP